MYYMGTYSVYGLKTLTQKYFFTLIGLSKKAELLLQSKQIKINK